MGGKQSKKELYEHENYDQILHNSLLSCTASWGAPLVIINLIHLYIKIPWHRIPNSIILPKVKLTAMIFFSSNNHHYLITASNQENFLSIWNISNSQLTQKLIYGEKEKDGIILSLHSFSNNKIISCSERPDIISEDLHSNEIVTMVQIYRYSSSHTWKIMNTVAVDMKVISIKSLDHNYFIVAGFRDIRIFDNRNGEGWKLNLKDNKSDGIIDILSTSSSEIIALAGNAVDIYNGRNGDYIRSIKLDTPSCGSNMMILPKSNKFITTNNNKIYIYSSNGQFASDQYKNSLIRIITNEKSKSEISKVLVLGDTIIGSFQGNGWLQVFETATGLPLDIFPCDSSTLAFSTAGLLALQVKGQIFIYRQVHSREIKVEETWRNSLPPSASKSLIQKKKWKRLST